jgi:hypothetical protein
MTRKSRCFTAAFAVTLILIGAFCGFAAVDLSMERYMPGQFGPMFTISQINSDGVDFSAFAVEYRLDARPFKQARAFLSQYRGLFPAAPRAASALTAEIIEKVMGY